VRRDEPAAVQTFHTQHGRPVRDPKTGAYHCVKIGPQRRHPHNGPASQRVTATTGKLKPHQLRYTPRKPPVAASPQLPPDRPSLSRNFSTQSELYLFHKAKGTLREYFAMFGIDWRLE
jgi:hypothetical protein